jgi:hypothetical protein
VTQSAYAGFQDGAVVEPLAIDGNVYDLQLADPALFYALDFFSWVITNYPGTRLVSTAQRLGATAIQSAVGYRYPSLPSPDVFQATQIKFPLLAVGRTETLTGRLTASWEHDRGLFELVYALPPGLTAGQKEGLLPHLHAVAQALHNKVTQGWDPGYTPPGGTLGQSPWLPQFAGVENIGFGDPYRDFAKSVTYGYLEDTGNLLAPCIRMYGYMTERDQYNSAAVGAVKLAGFDVTTDLVASDGAVVDPFVQVSTQMAPTITNVTPSSGPHAGGTSLTVTGTLFLPGPVVYVGTQRAFGVTWNSATSLTVVTPANANPGTVGITVINRDGQSAAANGVFTYS